MPVNLLRDASIQRVSLVRKGANRRRFYLLKSADSEGAEPLPAGRIVKAADWSAAYVVVAEPGWHEDPGQGAADQSIEDRWADAEEIRKAAHGWMRNGGQVNRNHEGADPYGQTVESFIAPADFTVGDETIRKGAWVIGIEPTAEGRELIDRGEISGVSIEGTATRELVEKGADPEDRPAKGEGGLLRKMAEKLGIKADDVEPPTTAPAPEGDGEPMEAAALLIADAIVKCVLQEREAALADAAAVREAEEIVARLPR